MELIARKTVHELEGDEGAKHLEEYADAPLSAASAC
jgi:amidophosphoribosyltransferase